MGVIELRLEEVLWTVVVVFYEIELPHTLHREETCGCGLVALLGERLVLEGEEVVATLFAVLLV